MRALGDMLIVNYVGPGLANIKMIYRTGIMSRRAKAGYARSVIPILLYCSDGPLKSKQY